MGWLLFVQVHVTLMDLIYVLCCYSSRNELTRISKLPLKQPIINNRFDGAREKILVKKV